MAQSTGAAEEDQKRADNNAIVEIMNEIRMSVTSTLQTYYHEESSTSGIYSDSDVVSKISVQYAQETVEGIKIAERYYNPKTKVYYAYAYISRQRLEDQFKEKADKATQLCADYHRYAVQLVADHDIYGALGHYIRALGELFVVQAFLKTKIRGDIDNSGHEEMLQARLENEIVALVGKLNFEVVSGNNQHAQRGRALEQPLIGRVTFTTGSGSFNVANIPLKADFVNATGDLLIHTTSDRDGLFSVRVNLIESAEAETGIIRIRLDLADLEPFREELKNVFARLEQVGCDFNFNIDVAASIRIFVSILEEVDGSPVLKPYAAGALKKSLVHNKYTVIEPEALPGNSGQNVAQAVQQGDNQALANTIAGQADYAIVGHVSSTNGGGLDVGIKFAYANAEVRVIDIKTARVVATTVQSRIKGGAGDEAAANRDAIKKCADKLNTEIIAGLKEALK